MSKRKINSGDDPTKQKISKKYSLDSDEEDDTGEDENILDDNDIEGEEEGISGNIGQERYTAFNMREEMEEGHFDKDGHFIWKNEKEVRDNWLDNIDWQTIRPDKVENPERSLGNESDDSEEEPFREIEVYKEILTYMEPKETITKSLRRLGGKSKQLSSIERLKRKKAGILDSNDEVTELTELADKVLSKTGNMDIYQETYEAIHKKIKDYEAKYKPSKETELDMYADDFDTKEKQKLEQTAGTSTEEKTISSPDQVMWEIKRDLKEDKIEGPYNTQQMLKWANEGYFKTGVWTRRHGEDSNFYSTNRIDFELYV
ncbi:hypothetical protein ILUMI_20408 [Ignelater luminosus]|uniref:GYF domain-containing protein n=1 Tax=Ignelater luminosus TaxID=2038154 RepID=A0A8K0CEC6_IGNLU|nr:hypothetical protein ILUMI_20408 [Ignelater luminosus]